MTMTIEVPEKLDAALQSQARAKGVSAAGFVQQVLEQILAPVSGAAPTSELPILHLGLMDSLHRRDLYNDVR